MATKSAIGSMDWVAAEKENVQQLLEQEKEELVFPAQHEFEWLNEHMADIFSKSHLEMANLLKTPGKLRGKTPRTARKCNVAEPRIPLSDVFSSKPISRASPAKPQNGQLKFAVARDIDSESTSQASQSLPPQRAQKSQADSGYQGSSQMNDDSFVAPPNVPPRSPLRTIKSPIIEDEEPRTTEGSFHSAKEDQTTKLNAPVQPQETAHHQATIHPTENDDDVENIEEEQHIEEEPVAAQPEFDEIGSPSDTSTPDRPLVRKGSMTFAALPAREPLKQSIGARASRTSHVELARSYGPPPDSHISRHDSITPTERPEEESDDEDLNLEDSDIEGSHIEILGRDESTINQSNLQIHGRDMSDDESQMLPKYDRAATQSLHAKLEALAGGPAPRMSKSIPSAAVAALRKSAEEHEQRQKQYEDSREPEEDDDWIKPLKDRNHEDAEQNVADVQTSPHAAETDAEDDYDVRAPELIAHEERLRAYASPSPQRPGFGHAKSASTATLISPAKAAVPSTTGHVKSVSVSNPALPSTTPQGSPKRFIDGTLSASKSRLQSIMNSAKGLFTKSAGVSAAAKMEAISPVLVRNVSNDMPGMYPGLDNVNGEKPLPPDPPRDARKTRSSSEREREEKRKERDQKAAEKMNADLDKARSREADKAAQQHASRAPSPRKASDEQGDTSTSKAQSHAKLGRPVRPTRDIGKAKPPPAVIKLASASARMQVNPAPVAAHHQESLQGEPKRPGLTKKTSTQSMSSTSTTTFKTSVSTQSAKPRALLAAEKKKEQDEREAQRKQEQKRELEKKRAAMQEEARKKEQREREEAERKERERLMAEQRKRQAQQEAIERKRQEATRKAEQQRQERAAAQDSAQPNRPPSRLAQQNVTRPLINHHLPTNPAKPPKRVPEEDNTRSQAPRFGAASQQADAKRRRTEDEQPQMQPSRPTMTGPPIRQSNFGKKPSIFTHSAYQQATGTTSQLSQFPQPPRTGPSMQHFANSKIPFADAPNHQSHPSKTPVSAAAGIRTINAIKSSPHYPNGDNIHLPDIPTDSEDEDSEDETANAFPLPDWATPGHLADQLMKQDDMDIDAVFGPIAPLRMEEIFAKGNKDRLKKLRDRTSSANWVMSGDGLTLEEVRADREQRERMKAQGGWRYGGN